MSRHTSYRGATIDMASLARENENSPAIGNMRVNAKGDQLNHNGSVAKTAEQIARESHSMKSAIINAGLKGPAPQMPELVLEKPKSVKIPVKATKAKETVETELDNGDIIVEDVIEVKEDKKE